MEIGYYRLFNEDLKKLNDIQLIVHYNTFHSSEKRLINRKGFYNKYPNFDIKFYKLYLDFLTFNEFDLIKHYWQCGIRENRLTSSKIFLETYPDFDCDFYKEIYNLTYLLNEQVYIYHWLNGKNENKIINREKFYEIYSDFDWTFYKMFNSDLNLINEFECIKHFILKGKDDERFISELKIPNEYNPYYYQKLNLDINFWDNFRNKFEKKCTVDNIIINRNVEIIDDFDKLFYDFDINIYKKENSDLTFLNEITYKKHFYYFGQFERRLYNDKIKIIIVCNRYNLREGFGSGADIILYNFAKKINDLNLYNIYAKLFVYDQSNIQNSFCNNFAHYGEINANSVVIYTDGMEGDPYNVKNIIRWILLEIGTSYRDKYFYKTWNINDYVYHWEKTHLLNAELRYLINIKLDDDIINPNFRTKTNDSCYLIKKKTLSASKIDYFHENNSVFLDNLSTENIKKYIFTSTKFYCYDLQTFFMIYAIIYKCQTFVYPDNTMTKEEYINKSVLNNFKYANSLFAYGLNDSCSINYDDNIIYDLILYLQKIGENSINNFIDDIVNIYIKKNSIDIPTVKTVYYDSNWNNITN